MERPSVDVIHLRDGRLIEDPLGKLRRFCDSEYALYDAVDTPQDDTLTVNDIVLSVAVNSRLDAKGLSSVWQGKASVEQHLRLISPAVSLTDPEDAIPWDTIVRMFEEFEHIKYAKLAVASKILHKKRPALIPMMDDVVRKYYEGVYPSFPWSWKCGPLSGQLMRHFREDLLVARPQLETLAASQVDTPLTLVRLLELLIWVETEPRGYYRTGLQP
jgi:hypothetical protein